MTVLLMDNTIRNDRRAIVSEVPANVKSNLNASKILINPEKMGIFNNTMGPL